jgi:hypothetical protein
MKYQVTIKMITQFVTEVEANNSEDAEDIAVELANTGELEIDCEYQESKVEEL